MLFVSPTLVEVALLCLDEITGVPFSGGEGKGGKCEENT